MNDNEMIDARFEMLKKHHTQTLNDAISNGLVDKPIISFLEKITEIPTMFTSSSCSGRIMLLIGDEDENKKNSSFLKKFHERVSLKEIKEQLANLPSGGVVWLKAEPFIFHFGLKDYFSAKALLDFCRSFGLKKAGIISAKEGKFTCEVTNTVYLSTVLAKDGKILVSEEYLSLLVDIANQKLENNFKKLDLFISSFLSFFA
jgi:tRNA wybutosine-synthesizing protein 3